MTLQTVILNRDFSTQPIHPINLRIDKLTWTAFGGCDEAFLSAGTPADRLLEFTGLLRCPITISEDFTKPAWWGYVNNISFLFEKINFIIDLEDLFNRVNVKYSFISPDGKLADLSETGFAEDTLSKTEFGTREIVLRRNNIDDDFAGNLRDTFLKSSAFPNSILSRSNRLEDPVIKIHCKGWFHTLDWVSYQNLSGFYANHGPGPGALAFGNGTVSHPAQSFTPAQAVDVKYVYVQLRKVGSPTSNLNAEIWLDSGDTPNIWLANSATVAGSGLPSQNYIWVNFTFATAITLTAATKYWLVIDANTSSGTNYYQIRIDENSSYFQADHYGRCYSGSWVLIPSITNPGSRPDLFFRVVCEQDTGAQLFDIATAGNQFFDRIDTITSGVKTSPYRNNGNSVLKEVLALMKLGTSNQRQIMACVNSKRQLYFNELPDAAEPTIYMDRFGRFFTKDQKFLQPYFPPIGQFATLSGIDRLVMPFDRHRIPTYFVDQATYTP